MRHIISDAVVETKAELSEHSRPQTMSLPRPFDHGVWGPDPGPSDMCGHSQGPWPETAVTGLHRGHRPWFGSISVGGFARLVPQKGAAASAECQQAQ